jgi:hypothetical protein
MWEHANKKAILAHLQKTNRQDIAIEESGLSPVSIFGLNWLASFFSLRFNGCLFLLLG